MNGDGANRDLEGVAAVVTGSARNIGRAIALALAERGASVAINARRSAALAEETAHEVEARGGRALVHLADVTIADQAAGLIDAAVGAFGGLDILVNNVATRMHTPLVDTSFEDWHAVIASVLDSAFLCSRAAIPHLAKGGRGAIVNIGGVSGYAGVANRAHVAAAKAGLSGMTGALAIELAPQSITVNCVSPGYIDTKRDGGVPQHFQDKPTPAGRPGTPEEIAGIVRLLCGPEGRFITGETIHVNGGWHVSIA